MIFVHFCSANFPPEIAASAVFVITIGQAFSFQLNVTDDNSNPTLTAEGTLLQTSTLQFVGATLYTFSGTLSEVDRNASLIFVASDGNATSTFVPRLQLCACENGGNCTTEGIFNLDVTLVVLNCDCSAGFYK